ncbi:WASH complex subunit 2 isoform X2 [Musca domestica]|uniref:WASH complex subunit FAM21 homolog isoform X2 n=1 Tax=Musca domestica TaxID=7370 RepID=A0A1I8M7L5_MUSDO|nr:WASH complex subunit 2 isoform X2 [Musca domestica]
MEPDTSDVNLDSILDQAGDWTFAGDYQLLQWMNKISQNLHARASRTTENFDRLNNNVKYTHNALDNVTNSLTALQYGNQFVECRVEDDDETASPSGNNLQPTNGVDKLDKPSAKETFAAFLDNNLKLLRIYEKYSIDVYDSDDDDDDVDEGKREKTCIFQPVNPYNERPLPHIFGSKDWHMSSHVGLQYEQRESSYSGDEASDAFSESSLSAAADNDDSYETNSECASSFSASNNTFGGNFEVRNASSALIPPKTSNSQSFSESSSAQSSSAKIINFHTPTNNVKRSESSSSTNSKNPSLQESNATKVTTLPKPRPFQSNIPPYTDLFSEPPEDVQSTPSSSISRKTVNLFNDDDDEVYKHLSIAGSIRNEPVATTERKASFTGEKKPTVDQQSIAKPKTYEIPKPVFVDELQDKLFHKTDTPRSAVTAVKQNNKTQSTASPANRHINLFDDEDDDDDFLSAFVRKDTPSKLESQPTLATESLKKPSPEINKFVGVKDKTENKKRHINLFEDSNDEEDDVQFKTGPIKGSEKQDIITKPSIFSSLKTTNLFDDDEDEDEDNLFKVKPRIFSAGLDKLEKKTEISSIAQSKQTPGDVTTTPAFETKIKAIDLFEDDVKEKTISPSIENPKETEKNVEISEKSNEVQEKSSDIKEVHHQAALKPLPGDVNEQNKDNESIIPSPKLSRDTLEDTHEDTHKHQSNNLKTENLFDKVVALHDPTVQQKNASEGKKSIFDDDLIIPSPLPRKSSVVQEEDVPPLSNNVVEHKVLTDKEKQHTDTSKVTTPLAAKITNLFDGNDDNVTNPDEADKTVSIDANVGEENYKPDLFSTASENKEKEESLVQSFNLAKESGRNSNVPEDTVGNVFEDPPHIDIPCSDGFIKKTPEIKNDNNQLEQNANEPVSDEGLTVPPEVVTSSSTKTYNFDSSLLFDEPPDDNDFFESLGKSSQNPSVKFGGFDLDHDLYSEPEMSKTVTAPADKVSEYKGLQLFSDIPPEDNDFEDVIEQRDTKEIGTTKKLSSVFYDDFNETIQAIDRNQNRPSTYLHPVFDEEPPSVDKHIKDESTLVKKHEAPADIEGNYVGIENESDANVISEKSITSQKDNEKTVVENLTRISDKEVMIAKTVSDENVTNVKSFNYRPISKLQMPNFNINVQALLPGGVGKTNSSKVMQKQREESEQHMPPSTPIETKANHDGSPSIQKDHILPNVNKNRVRAPLNRRPSTRKARQENIRKSLLEENLIDDQTDENNMTETHKNSMVHAKPPEGPENKDISIHNTKGLEIEKEAVKKEAQKVSALSFLDGDDEEADDIDLFKNIVSKNVGNNPKNTTVGMSATLTSAGSITTVSNKPSVSAEINTTNTKSPANPLVTSKDNQNPLTTPMTSIAAKTPSNLSSSASKEITKPSSKSLFTDSDSESESDFFAKLVSSKQANLPSPATQKVKHSVSEPPPKMTATQTIASNSNKHSSLFSDDSDDDEDFLKPSTKLPLSKSKPKATTHSSSIFSDIDSDDDDNDLFKSTPLAKKNPSSAATQVVTKHAAETKQSTKTPIADNPLADLL